MSYKKSQKESLVNSGIKLMNRRSTYQRDGNTKKNQTKILELKSSINEIKNALESTGNRADHMKERISELNDRNDTGEKEIELRS